jgi:hypothetical protein
MDLRPHLQGFCNMDLIDVFGWVTTWLGIKICDGARHSAYPMQTAASESVAFEFRPQHRSGRIT